MHDFDFAIIGAGVIGLAIARELSLIGASVIVIEKESRIGVETSSRNSEVIHAGLYYPQNSLKARYCVQGNKLIYEYCKANNLPFKKCGKLIVASNKNELVSLHSLAKNAHRNGCTDIKLLSKYDAQDLEPELDCLAAILSSSTGIIDSHQYMLQLQSDAEQNGVSFVFLSPFMGAKVQSGLFILEVGGREPTTVSTQWVVNCAGLHASSVASKIEGLKISSIPKTNFAKGNYFNLVVRSPFSHLIYPAPQKHGLGIHLTLDLENRTKFGPDVEWVNEIDYSVDPERAKAFYDSVRRYWPSMPNDSLIPAYAGIRPKICRQDEPPSDFRIDGFAEHGLSGLINLFGFESPGLTSSLAIALDVVKKTRMK